MNQEPTRPLRPAPDIAAALGAEMDRIECLIAAIHRHREGRQIGQDRRKGLAAAQDATAAGRAAGVLDPLLPALGDIDRDVALDCLMVVGFLLVRPSKAYLFKGLQGEAPGEIVLTEALLHELLMPDDAHEVVLTRALSPVSPLVRSGLIRAEGHGPGRQLRPGIALARFVTGSEGHIVPPDAVRLVYEPGQSLRPLFLEPRVARRLDEIEALIGLLAEGGQPMAGPAVLFSGSPGTGKSLAVHHLAARLGRPLFQLDLGRVVSKWLGETEANLSRVFDEMAGTEGCILLDEADALLSKRVEVKESRDQYANMTVSHLLSLLERHDGPVFLTTNFRGNLDEAYTRRLAAVVEFDLPDRGRRQEIWKSALGRAAPGCETGHLLPAAAYPQMSAAEIVNAAVLAASLARGETGHAGPTLIHVTRAIMLEKMKGDATFSRSDLGPLAEHWLEEDTL